MQKHDSSKATAFALESIDLHPASRFTVDGSALVIARCMNCAGVWGEKRPGDKESGKLLKCADANFLTKHVKRLSSRTCL